MSFLLASFRNVCRWGLFSIRQNQASQLPPVPVFSKLFKANCLLGPALHLMDKLALFSLSLYFFCLFFFRNVLIHFLFKIGMITISMLCLCVKVRAGVTVQLRMGQSNNSKADLLTHCMFNPYINNKGNYPILRGVVLELCFNN